jgi:hypothetical protein
MVPEWHRGVIVGLGKVVVVVVVLVLVLVLVLVIVKVYHERLHIHIMLPTYAPILSSYAPFHIMLPSYAPNIFAEGPNHEQLDIKDGLTVEFIIARTTLTRYLKADLHFSELI